MKIPLALMVILRSWSWQAASRPWPPPSPLLHRTPTPPTAAPSPVPTTEAGTPVVIDTDMGIDDVMAILYMLQRPDVEVKAITVAGDGLVHCDAGTPVMRLDSWRLPARRTSPSLWT